MISRLASRSTSLLGDQNAVSLRVECLLPRFGLALWIENLQHGLLIDADSLAKLFDDLLEFKNLAHLVSVNLRCLDR